jgi:hypothetical protein
MELTNDSELRVKMDDKHNCRFFFGIDRGNGFDATVKFEHHQELTEDPKPDPITSSLDGVGEVIGLSLEIRDMILDMRKSMYTEKDMKSFAEYYVQELNSVRKILPDCAASDLLFNEWKSKCQKY